ncbi:MAG: RES family NAD+ phosphorylase [Fimbriiglobus sp.]
MQIPWPEEQLLRERLAELATKTHPLMVIDWQGTTYRFASRSFADQITFINGEGARRNGGRFTPVGSQRTLYLSSDRATATAELDSWYEYYGIPDNAFQPRILAAVAVSMGLLLDLVAVETLSRLGLDPQQIHEDWRLISDQGGVAAIQTLGRLAYEAGFEGVRYPSARRVGGFNFALFPDNYHSASHAMMLNSE